MKGMGNEKKSKCVAYFLLANWAAVALRGGSSGVSGPSDPPYLELPSCASANLFDMVAIVENEVSLRSSNPIYGSW